MSAGNAIARPETATHEVSDGVVLTMFDFGPAHGAEGRPLLVFVAGWISLLSGWEKVLSELVPRFRVLYLETREKKSAILPGPARKISFSPGRMAQDIHEILAQRAPEGLPFYLAGSSLGAALILEHLAQSPLKPRESFLISPISRMHYPPLALAILRLIPPSWFGIVKPWIKWYLATFRCDRKNEPEQVRKYEGTIDAAEPARLKQNAIALENYSVWPVLSRVTTPVHLIGGRTDTLHGVEELEKMAALLPDARLTVLESNRETHSEVCGRLMAEAIMEREGRKG